MNSEWTANEKHVVGEGGLVNFQVVRGFVVVVLVVDWCNEIDVGGESELVNWLDSILILVDQCNEKDVGGEAEEEVLVAGHLQLHRPQPLIQPPITSRALTCIQCKK